MNRSPLIVLGLLFLAVALSGVSADDSPDPSSWTSYGGDTWSTKYSPLDQIDATNVKKLEIAWRWGSPENDLVAKDPKYRPGLYEATPLFIDGVLYTATSHSGIAAIDPGTGKTLWHFDSLSQEGGRPPNLGFIHRGVSYWSDGEATRIFIGTGDSRLIAVDHVTGEPIGEFGNQGSVDLSKGLRRPIPRRYYGLNSPPLVCGDVVVTGATIADLAISRNAPPGDVRGFDVRTGEHLWTFHSIPQAGEFGNETWKNESWKGTGNTNVWSLMSCDEELGYVYLPFGTPTSDYYGGERHGDNLFAESLVALDVETGERIWHFQAVHHGIWDYDFPCAPNLVDITVDGERIKAVAQASKQGFIYVFDRVTGEPVWPIEERKVPASSVPGEKLSPTQPFPTRPAPFERQGVRPEDLIDFTPELAAEARKILAEFDYGELFVPLGTGRPTMYLPGWLGGANWTGAAVDPETGVLYVPSITSPIAFTLTETDSNRSAFRYTATPTPVIGPDGLPLFKPPYGRITAIDLNSGEHLWMSPLGDGPRDHPRLAHLDLGPLGAPQRGAPLVTKTLLFVTQEGTIGEIRFSEDLHAAEAETFTSDPGLRVFDKQNGNLLTEIELPANAIAAPMTYLHEGKQYIAVSIGGGSQHSELVALALP